MAQTDELKLQNVDTTQAAPATKEERIRAARRRFLRQALAATSAIALAEIVPSALVEANPQTTCTPGPVFIPVREITNIGDKLQAVIKVKSGKDRIVPGNPNSPLTLRYFAGYRPDNLTTPVWPTTANVGPGPTLRCEIGNSVQITLLNQVDVAAFQGSLYSGERGTATGCDEVTKVSQTNPADTNWYPANDAFPNCFHASSAANLHFHGTHVTPSTTGDNILVNIQPAANMTPADERMIQDWFQRYIFNRGEAVKTWNELPKEWRDYQMGPWQNKPQGLVGEYDNTAPYTGPGANPNGHGLPANLKLWPKNDKAIKAGEWPQYFVGSYPTCFRIPKWNGLPTSMGQAPGTHWYHAHKHGSTSVNLFNGLAGALIITDPSPTGYDGKLQAIYSGRLEERVIVFQQITDTINMMVANQNAVTSPPLYVNGQSTPTITMRRGQIQLWRMINATVSTFISGQFKSCSGSTPLQCMQTAQDGVQFSQTNYQNQPLGNKGQSPLSFPLAPANRIDLLVQAPTTTGLHVMQTPGDNPKPILFIRVTDEPPINPPMQFPSVSAFPVIPHFLRDITANDVQVRREINYGSCVPNLPKQSRQPPLRQWTINGKQFEDGVVNQQIKLGAIEEWTIYNTTTQAAHPFHIHVNPFQIVEVYNPNAAAGQQLLKFDKDFVWWDVFAIPTAKQDANGNVIASGYFKMRSRFVDFTGMYVHHCHILAHEDRGMMQLVEVCRDLATCGTHTNLSHH